MADWQPIESAPKDGRQILIYTRLGYMHCALWAKGDPAYSRPDGWMVVSQPERSEVVLAQEHVVTHWRPLPLAPNPAEGRTNAKREARRFVSQHVRLEATILKIARGMDELCTDEYEIDMTKGEHDAGTD